MDLHAVADNALIQLYRLTGYVGLDYFIGTLLLAFLTVVVGEFTISVALRFNRRHIEAMENEMMHSHTLSMEALQVNDREGYQACNRQANDAFGKYFFSMIAHSAAILWPVPFALAWMQSRFSGVEFPFSYPISLLWPSTGFATTFILSYILTRILFKYLRPHLPYFREVHRSLNLDEPHALPERK